MVLFIVDLQNLYTFYISVQLEHFWLYCATLYIYRKKELREIDHRIRYLQKRLPDLKIVDTLPTNLQQVFFAAWVTLEDEAGEEKTYRIVGPDEFDPKQDWISMDSPVARALLKKLVDDEVKVVTPSGTKTFYINRIRYK